MEKVLTQVCNECRNFFVKTYENGTYAINNGVIILKNNYLIGQFIQIKGSVLNDGVYKVSDNLVTLDGAFDETFLGVIYGLAIPADFLDIVEDIKKQIEMDKNDKSNKELTGESYSNYSYSRAVNSNGVGASWKEVFYNQLNPYRKMINKYI